MRSKSLCSVLGLLLAALLPGSADAQSCGNLYDLNGLAGDDVAPFTPLDGQDGWTAESYNVAVDCGVTATLGYDGTQALRFEASGPGFGCDASRLNDANYAIPTFTGSETSAFYQADFGVGYWGNSSGPAYDLDGNGKVRGSEAGERGPRLLVGSHANVGVTVVSAAGNKTTVPLSDAGGSGGGDWLRLRLVMDLTANAGSGSGSVDYMNLTNGETSWTPIAGLQGVDVELSPGSGDAADPVNWNGVWLHFEGATNQLDNIEVGLQSCDFGGAYCFGDGSGTPCPCGNLNDGSLPTAGCANGQYASGAMLSASGSASVTGDTLVLVGQHTENNQSGLYFQANNDLSPGNIWGDGLQCAGGQLKRLGVRFSDATGYSDTSAWTTPISVKAGNVTAGDTKYYQLWYRNPDNSPCSAEFNASNGYAITWAP